MKARTFYTYVYYNPDTMTPFYVGKGYGSRDRAHLQEARRWDRKIVCRRHKNYMKLSYICQLLDAGKTPIIVRTLSTANEEEALLEEQRLIALFGKRCNQTGCLTNFADGGQNGSRPSEIGIQRLRARWKGAVRTKTAKHIEHHKNSIQTRTYHTPKGDFISSTDAASANDVSHNCIIRRCVHFNDQMIKVSREPTIPKSWVGKTWKEIGFGYTEFKNH